MPRDRAAGYESLRKLELRFILIRAGIADLLRAIVGTAGSGRWWGDD
jgi:hypothetical protein